MLIINKLLFTPLKEQAPALKEIADKRISEFKAALNTYIAIH